MTHKFRLLREPQPLCYACDCYLTVKHVLIECTKYDRERTRFFGRSVLKMGDILDRGNFVKINRLLEFLKQAKLFSEI